MKRDKRIQELESQKSGNPLIPDGLSEIQAELLLSGWSLDGDIEYPEAERKKDWEKHRGKLLAYWFRTDIDASEKNYKKLIGMAIPKGPFTRPAAWWRFEATEPRKKLTTGGIDTEGKEWSMDYRESQKEYLVRLDLLTETEKQLLTNDY